MPAWPLSLRSRTRTQPQNQVKRDSNPSTMSYLMLLFCCHPGGILVCKHCPSFKVLLVFCDKLSCFVAQPVTPPHSFLGQ